VRTSSPIIKECNKVSTASAYYLDQRCAWLIVDRISVKTDKTEKESRGRATEKESRGRATEKEIRGRATEKESGGKARVTES